MKKFILLTAVTLFVFGCKKEGDATTVSDIEETAQQIGDIMASMDEQGGDDGTVVAANQLHFEKTFARFNQEPPVPTFNNILSALVPKAEAVACYTSGIGSGWGTCSGRVLRRTFNDCTIGTSVTISGDVTLTWSGTAGACDWGGTPVAGDAIKRIPNFTITGRRGATLAVTAKRVDGTTASDGQLLKYVSGSSPNMVFNFTNDGIRRKFTTVAGATLFDQTTTVASGTPIVVTGNSRANRTMNGGFLVVTDTLNGVICQFSPSNVTWSSSTCNCAVQGSWSGSCDNGKAVTLDITGCGTGTYTEGGESTFVTFDRCSSN